MVVGVCLPFSEDAQEWLLFIELVFEHRKCHKTKGLRLFKGGKGNATFLAFAGWILRMLLVGMVLLARLKSVLLFVRAVTQAAPCCTHPTHCSACPWVQHFLQPEPLVRRYQRLFAVFDFSFLPSLPASCIPLQAFLKAYIVMVDQGIQTFTRLRTFLLEHPAGTWCIGFRPNNGNLPLCPSTIDWEQLVPSDRYLREKIQGMDHLFFKTLLAQTIQKIKALELLDGKVACDVKEIWASVKQNNPKQFVKDRWNKEVLPTGNPDARLGAKPSSNRDPKGKPLPRLFWGFKSAIFAATTHHGLVILAETTCPADTGDVSCFTPLLKEFLSDSLKATIFLADAAFDAWYVYRDIAQQGGKAYIPLNSRGHDVLEHAYSKNGKLLCPAGREMKSV